MTGIYNLKKRISHNRPSWKGLHGWGYIRYQNKINALFLLLFPHLNANSKIQNSKMKEFNEN